MLLQMSSGGIFLEARLLTSESFAEIAARFATEAPVIDCFEKLFFNVRDRLDCTRLDRQDHQGPA